jgi:hypothetical protein
MLERLRIRPGAALFVLGLVAGAGDEGLRAAPPLDPPEQYRAYGDALVTIDGPSCCGGVPLTATFEAAYEVDSAGGAVLKDLRLAIDDANVVVRGGFLGLFSERILLRCGGIRLTAHAHGSVAAPDRLELPPGSVELWMMAAESREPDGACPPPTLSFGGSNSSVVRVTHKPGEDFVDLDATTIFDADGSPYTMHMTGTGRFQNRPPRAALAFRYPDGTFPQGGCPAFWYWNGQQDEQVAEANGPAGLTASLRSYSVDPDGSWGAADVLNDLWFDTRAGGVRTPLASGRDVGPFVFGWGTDHDVDLLALDHAGAADAVSCHFRVADTKPPVVQAPPPLVTGCSTSGGANRATSVPLAAFLGAATASDVVDTTPTALPPQVGGANVAPTTLFPADGLPRTVRFQFTDDAGRLGFADGTVKVLDVVAPTVAVTASPAVLPVSLSLFAVTANPAASDACGGPLTYRLKSITSNYPANDAADIQGAAIGTDDRTFQLRGRPAKPGVARLYKIVYEAKDPAGNIGSASAVVTVPAS